MERGNLMKESNTKRIQGWKAVIVIAAVSVALLWHMLACVDSPMSFSPDGQSLAFTTMQPSHEDIVKGQQVFRLMVLTGKSKIRVLEETREQMLTAPAYSHNGKHICYVRIPLLTKKQADAVKKFGAQATSFPAKDSVGLAKELFGAKSRATTQPADQSLPPVDAMGKMFAKYLAGPLTPCVLVLRNAKSGKVTSTLNIQLQAVCYDGTTLKRISDTYLMMKPQFSPDDRTVYLWSGHSVLAVDLQTGGQKTVAAPATMPVLSPDGKTLAVRGQNCIGFVRTDGQITTWRRWEKEIVPFGMLWLNNKTLGILPKGKKNAKKTAIYLLHADGSSAGNIPLEIDKPKDILFLAVSPDSKNMVVASYDTVFFLDGKGNLIKKLEIEEKRRLVHPTYSPDSKRIAFKVMQERDVSGESQMIVTDIEFYKPDGTVLSRNKVPVTVPGTIQPTSRPDTAAKKGEKKKIHSNMECFDRKRIYFF